MKVDRGAVNSGLSPERLQLKEGGVDRKPQDGEEQAAEREERAVSLELRRGEDANRGEWS